MEFEDRWDGSSVAIECWGGLAMATHFGVDEVAWDGGHVPGSDGSLLVEGGLITYDAKTAFIDEARWMPGEPQQCVGFMLGGRSPLSADYIVLGIPAGRAITTRLNSVDLGTVEIQAGWIIPRSVTDRLFHPAFRKKDQQVGAGLNLWAPVDLLRRFKVDGIANNSEAA